MKQTTLISAAIVALFISGAAGASEIYKWTDAEGNVQYGDKPLGSPSERLDIASRNTDPAAVQAQVQARLERKSARDEQAAEQQAGQPSAEEVRANKQAREERCVASRDRLTLLLQSRRVYKQGENGEREYLDESATQAARAKATKDVEEYCGS